MLRWGLLAWLEDLEETCEDVADIPTLDILWEPDILERGWGWQRLLPYDYASIEWPKFKEYLQHYFDKNADQVAALIMNNKPDFYIWGIPPNLNPLRAAADLCLKSEVKLQSLPRALSDEDIKLSLEIMEHARLTLESGEGSFLAAPGFVCILKEAELMYQLLQRNFDSTNFINFSNRIRRSAFNVMRHNVDKSTAVPAAAAMVGLAKEAKIARCMLAREDIRYYRDYDVCHEIRAGTTEVLTMLENEFARDFAGNGGVPGAPTTKPEKPEARTTQG